MLPQNSFRKLNLGCYNNLHRVTSAGWQFICQDLQLKKLFEVPSGLKI
jgi:hypothetical protein